MGATATGSVAGTLAQTAAGLTRASLLRQAVGGNQLVNILDLLVLCIVERL